MLRETRARILASATAVLVVGMAALFALLHNPRPSDESAAPAAAGPAEAAFDETGRQAFATMNCTRCHSLAGQGNAASRLDGVGSRLDREAIRAWTVGEGPAREALGASLAQMKSRYADDPRLEAVLDYLARQRVAR